MLEYSRTVKLLFVIIKLLRPFWMPLTFAVGVTVVVVYGGMLYVFPISGFYIGVFVIHYLLNKSSSILWERYECLFYKDDVENWLPLIDKHEKSDLESAYLKESLIELQVKDSWDAFM